MVDYTKQQMTPGPTYTAGQWQKDLGVPQGYNPQVFQDYNAYMGELGRLNPGNQDINQMMVESQLERLDPMNKLKMMGMQQELMANEPDEFEKLLSAYTMLREAGYPDDSEEMVALKSRLGQTVPSIVGDYTK
jgi:hypothetical protein